MGARRYSMLKVSQFEAAACAAAKRRAFLTLPVTNPPPCRYKIVPDGDRHGLYRSARTPPSSTSSTVSAARASRPSGGFGPPSRGGTTPMLGALAARTARDTATRNSSLQVHV